MIAMALVHNPDVLIADEPTTALDVTVQAQILELIDKVKRDFDIGVILVTHDLGVVAETAQSVMVMYAGRAVEHGPAAEVFARPQHPYTWGLLESMPSVEGKVAHLHAIEGSPPSVIHLPPGCAFHPRCPHRFDPCDKVRPPLARDRGRPPRRLPSRRRRQAPPVGRARGACGWGSAPDAARRRDHRGRAPDEALPGRRRACSRGAGARCTRSRTSRSACAAARRSASSASPAAASRRPRG